MSAPVGDAPTDQGTRWVAVLLAAAAIVAAILATRAAFLGNEANDAWQRSLRTEIKRGALLTIAVRYVYGAEAGQAFEIAKHEILAHEMRARAADLDPAVAEVLLREASIHETVISQARTTMEVASERYALPDGGLTWRCAWPTSGRGTPMRSRSIPTPSRRRAIERRVTRS